MKPSFCRFQIRACNDRDGTLIISNGYNDVITSPYVRIEERLSVPSLAKASSYVQSAELTFASLGLNDLSKLVSEIDESFEIFREGRNADTGHKTRVTRRHRGSYPVDLPTAICGHRHGAGAHPLW